MNSNLQLYFYCFLFFPSSFQKSVHSYLLNFDWNGVKYHFINFNIKCSLNAYFHLICRALISAYAFWSIINSRSFVFAYRYYQRTERPLCSISHKMCVPFIRLKWLYATYKTIKIKYKWLCATWFSCQYRRDDDQIFLRKFLFSIEHTELNHFILCQETSCIGINMILVPLLLRYFVL